MAEVEKSTLTQVTVVIPPGISLGPASLRVTTEKGTTVVGGLTIVP